MCTLSIRASNQNVFLRNVEMFKNNAPANETPERVAASEIKTCEDKLLVISSTSRHYSNKYLRVLSIKTNAKNLLVTAVPEALLSHFACDTRNDNEKEIRLSCGHSFRFRVP